MLASLVLAASLCLSLCSCGSKQVTLNEKTEKDDEQNTENPDEGEPTGDEDPEPEPVPVEPEPVPVEPEPVPEEPEEEPTEEEPEDEQPEDEEPEENTPVLPEAEIKGRLVSEQSKSLKLVVDYAYLPDTSKVAAIVSVQSYKLNVNKPKTGTLTVGDKTKSFSSTALINEENAAKTFYIAELEFDAPDSVSIPISAEWNFAGTYSGVAIEKLTVEGTIEIE